MILAGVAFAATGFVGGSDSVQIKVTTRHGHLSEEHQQQIRDKVARLEHHFPRLMQIEVIADVKDSENKVELLVSAEHKHDFVATATHGEMMGAVDLVLDKLDQQIRKYKDKIQDHHRSPNHK